MADPVRLQILKATAARLGTIHAGNGYRRSPRRVERKVVFLDEANELPLLVVLPADDQNEKRYEELGEGAGELGMDGGLIFATMGVEVAILAEGSRAELVGDVIEDLVADVEEALTTPDLHLGLDPAVVTDIRDTGQFLVDYLNSPEWVRGMAHVVYRVAYSYPRGTS